MRWSIRAKLTAIVLAVLLPLVAGALFKFWQEQRDSRERAQERLLLTAQVVARQFDEILSGQMENLEVLGTARAIDQLRDDDLAALARRVQASHAFVHGFVTATAQGRLLAASRPRARAAAGLETSRVFQEAIRTGEPQVGAPQASVVDRRPVVPLVLAVVDSTRMVRGVVVMELGLGALSSFLDGIPAGGAGVTLVTAEGRILARSSAAGKAAGALGSEAAQRLIRQGGGAAQWDAPPGGESHFVGAATLTRAPWVVLASVPSSVADARAAARLGANLAGLGVATFVALLLAWLIGRQMSQAIGALIAGARGLVSGRPAPIVVRGTDELAELGEQFNRAMQGRHAVEAELDARQRRLHALAEVNLALSRELDTERLLQQITDVLAHLTGAYVVVLWEARMAERRLARRASTAHPSVGTVDLPASLGFDEGVTGWIATHRQPLVVDDITGDPRVMALGWATRHDLLVLAGVPIESGDDLVGVLTLNLKRGHSLGPDELSLLQSFASQAAVAVRNAGLFADARARREAAEAVAGLGRLLAQAGDPEEVAPQVADGIRTVLGARASGLYRLDPASGYLIALALSGEVGSSRSLLATVPPGTGVLGLAVRERKPMASTNLPADQRVTLTAESRTWLAETSNRSVLAVPLVGKDAVIGALGVADREGRVFTAEEIRLIQTFADQVALAMENARLFGEATRRRREAEELARVARMFTESLDVAEVGRRVVDGVLPVFSAVSSALYLLNLDGSMRAIAWGGRARHAFEVEQVFPAGVGMMGRAVVRGATVWCRDVLAEPGLVLPEEMRARIVAAGSHAILAVPLQVKGQIIGVLSIADGAARDFSPAEVGLLEAFGDQAAVALENARLFATVQRRRREAEELARVSRAFAQTLDPDGVARQIVESLQIVFGVRTAVLFRLEPGSEELVTWVSAGALGDPVASSFVYPRGTGLAGRAVRERRPVASANLVDDPLLPLPDAARAWLARVGIETGLAVPLMIHERLIGALSLGDVRGRVFDDSDVTLAQAFADEAALVLENARLFGEATRRRREAEELARVVRTLTESLDVADVGQRIVDSVLPLLHARFARLRLRQPDGALHGVAWAGTVQGPDDGTSVFPPGVGVAGQAVAEGRPVRSSDVLNDPRFPLTDEVRQMLVSSGARAIAGAPLRVRGEIIGSLTIGDDVGRVFSDDAMVVLETFADQAALALDNARLYEQTRERLRELQETQAQLVQAAKLSAVGQLVSGVAHELNNPLSVVIGHGQLMLARGTPPEVRRPVELIVAQGHRMARIVQGLLLFSRQRQPSRGPVDIAGVIGQIIELRMAQLRVSGIRVETSHAEKGALTTGDVHQLQQVFLNLLLNAEQAILGAGEGDLILVRTRTRDDGDGAWIVVEVEDNGPGIAADVLPRVFDPFFTTKPVGQGTGLGLSVSYGIVQQHGGRLSAESRRGHTVFTVELPVIAGADGAPAPPPEAPRAVGAGRRALVVEDEPDLVELLSALLRQTGWSVDVASGGRPAIERVRAADYDLIVSDIRMPDGSGEEFYRAALAERRELGGRFLFVTGDTANPVAWRFLEETGAPVLEKPFTAEALLRIVERLVPDRLAF